MKVHMLFIPVIVTAVASHCMELDDSKKYAIKVAPDRTTTMETADSMLKSFVRTMAPFILPALTMAQANDTTQPTLGLTPGENLLIGFGSAVGGVATFVGCIWLMDYCKKREQSNEQEMSNYFTQVPTLSDASDVSELQTVVSNKSQHVPETTNKIYNDDLSVMGTPEWYAGQLQTEVGQEEIGNYYNNDLSESDSDTHTTSDHEHDEKASHDTH